jgi:hypothetical protein
LNNNEGKSKHRIRSSSRRVISQVKHACNLTQQRDWLLQGGLIASFAQIAGTENPSHRLRECMELGVRVLGVGDVIWPYHLANLSKTL